MRSVLAVSGQQAVGVGIGIALLVGWAIYVLFNMARPEREPGSEITEAPNRRRYVDDDALEGPKLDRALTWGLLTLAFVAVALPVYWLKEPGRQTGATRGFDKKSVDRGAELFQASTKPVPPGHIAAGCANCHGDKGQGGVVDFVLQKKDPAGGKDLVIPVKWAAPALDTVLYRFSPDEVRNIIVYGRPPTPMPAWGVKGGGALGDQQVDDLVNFLVSIQKSQKDVTESAQGQGLDGKTLFENNCARCHTLGWSYKDSYKEPDAVDGGGAFGPSLVGGDTLRQFPDVESHVEFIVSGSDFQKNYGRRGIGSGRMPGFGPDPAKAGSTDPIGCRNAVCSAFRLGRLLSTAQIRAIVAYERSL